MSGARLCFRRVDSYLATKTRGVVFSSRTQKCAGVIAVARADGVDVVGAGHETVRPHHRPSLVRYVST